MQRGCIVVIDSDDVHAHYMSKIISSRRFQAIIFSNIETAKEQALSYNPKLIIADISLEDRDAQEMLSVAKFRQIPVSLFSTNNKIGFCILQKPVTAIDFDEIIRKLKI